VWNALQGNFGDDMLIEVVRLTSDDATLLTNVADSVFDEAIDPGRADVFLADSSHLLVVALDGDLVVGQCAAVITRHPDRPSDLYLDDLAVTPSHQRQGIARRMVDEMIDWGRSLNCKTAWLLTGSDNAAARAFYEAQGAKAVPVTMFEYDL